MGPATAAIAMNMTFSRALAPDPRVIIAPAIPPTIASTSQKRYESALMLTSVLVHDVGCVSDPLQRADIHAVGVAWSHRRG